MRNLSAPKLLRYTATELSEAYALRVALDRDELDETEYEDITELDIDIIDAGDAKYLPDGRIVLEADDGQRIAMREHAHVAAIQANLAAAKAAPRPKPAAQPREALAATTCPQIKDGHVCGGSLQQSGICPNCDLGKSGYRYRYTCESCGYDVATQEPL